MYINCGFRKIFSWLCYGYEVSPKDNNSSLVQKGTCVCKVCEYCSTRLFDEEGTSHIISNNLVIRTNASYTNSFFSTILHRPIKLNLYPEKLEYNRGGGFRVIEVSNLGEKRIAIKLKSTNKKLFFAKPVYTFITPKSTTFIHIFRENSDSNRPEKIVIHAVEVSYLDKDPTKCFNSLLNKFGEQFCIPIEIINDEN